ncbi:sensor histidine kinase [Streptomyces aureoverticillatus]|nr:sensor histidine kinase [Streptomyces aureoverticillatus]
MSSQFRRVNSSTCDGRKEASVDQHTGGLGPVDQGRSGSHAANPDAGNRPHAGSGRAADLDPRATAPESRWLGAVMHTAFFLLLAASLTRFLLRHPGEPRTPGIIALSAILAVLYLLGPAPGAAPSTRRPLWLGAVVGAWAVLVVLAPSFAWCAVPLFYTGLRTLPTRAALVLVTALTALVVAAQLRLAGGFDPNLAFAPPAVAAVATAVFLHMQQQTAQQRALIDDLIRTRRELAATERREGTLAERQRLSMEIHDTLAQGLSSQQMLLQAADRVWDADPATARAHVRTAEAITERGLAEARRFVHDLAPVDLADAGSDDSDALPSALRTLAERESETELAVRFHAEGKRVPLPGRAQSALLRIAQGALANVREHADASTAALTLTYLDDQVVLDIADDGKGFVVAAEGRGAAAPEHDPGDPGPGAADDGPGSGSREASGRAGRGHGLPAIRARARQLGGTLTVESAPGEGTVVSVSIPLFAGPSPASGPTSPSASSSPASPAPDPLPASSSLASSTPSSSPSSPSAPSSSRSPSSSSSPAPPSPSSSPSPSSPSSPTPPERPSSGSGHEQ